MKFRMTIIALAIAFAYFTAIQKADATSTASSQDHDKSVQDRGDHVMGFSHEKATHHFILYPDGGAIEVSANSAEDTATRDQIRMHLGHIAQMFVEGDFNAPMLIHDQVPPGVPTLQRLKKEVSYLFESTDRGGLVRITTKNSDARKAVYEFLRFQISDHHTGDTDKVSPLKK